MNRRVFKKPYWLEKEYESSGYCDVYDAYSDLLRVYKIYDKSTNEWFNVPKLNQLMLRKHLKLGDQVKIYFDRYDTPIYIYSIKYFKSWYKDS